MKDLKVSVGVWYLGTLLDRVPRGELRECFQTSDEINISQLMGRMLGGS